MKKLWVSTVCVGVFVGVFIFSAATLACNFCMQAQGLNPYLTAQGKGLTLNANYMDSEQVYHHTHRVDSQGKKEGWLIYQLSGFYSINPHFVAQIDVPFSIKTNIDYDEDSNTNPGSLTTGVGDVTLLGRWTFFSHHSLESTWLNGLELGLKFPTGATNKHDANGEAVDRHAMPGTGSLDALVGLTSSYVMSRGLQFTAHVLYNFAGHGRWATQKHRFGNSFNVALKSLYRVWTAPQQPGKSVFLVAGVSSESTGKEIGTMTDSGYEDNLKNGSTGGTVGFFDFGLYAPVNDAVVLNALVSEAIYHDANYNPDFEVDPLESYKINLGLTYLF